MVLTETLIRQTKAGPKPIKLFDGRGLYLLVNPNGSRWWRFKYRFEGREKLISSGPIPTSPEACPGPERRHPAAARRRHRPWRQAPGREGRPQRQLRSHRP